MTIANEKLRAIAELGKVAAIIDEFRGLMGIEPAQVAAITATLTGEINAAADFGALDALQLGSEEAGSFANTLARYGQAAALPFVPGLPHREFIRADSMEPANASWLAPAEQAPASVAAHVLHPFIQIASFDDSIDEGMGHSFRVPAGAVNLEVRVMASGSGTAGNIVVRLLGNTLLGTSAWTAAPTFALAYPANGQMQALSSGVIALSSLGLAANAVGKLQLVRVASDVGDTMVGSWQVESIEVVAT